MAIPYGVYIGKDIEAVFTEKYTLVYRKHPAGRRLESMLLTPSLNCLGICRTTPSGIPELLLNIVDKRISKVHQRDKTIIIDFEDGTESDIGTPPDNIKNALLGHKTKLLTQENDSIHIHYQGGDSYRFIAPEQIKWEYALLADEVISDGGKLKAQINTKPLTISCKNDMVVFTFTDTNTSTYTAKAHELFAMDDLSPFCPSPSESSIGECLRLWNIGCTDTYFKGQFSGVIINTFRHMYIFEITHGSVYCRAARYVTCDRGVVFDQNFRQGYEAYMVDDNRIAMQNLKYDESLFSTEACVWSGRSVYWSTAKVTDTEIELHGCQGDIYKWSKPTRE
ncbi:MAG: hypothetical protein ACYC5M_11300 [Anaerolineae bacterium]